jgi:hypothetical protein
MDTSLLLQQALHEFCYQLLEDKSFVTETFKRINKMKQEFGKGYILINVGEFNPNQREFIYSHPEGLGIL